ncbi:YicC family protein [Xaviernesmea oryzae]|uniref:YicC family protein n=1 Tax=Xaviernesmea oryzae TaxID=464029 RepID=A0A1Q9AT03_9HYPH|nr:YicC/YloC family endoribonuclease [Xaviernesmea oryzae]OLP58543.1 YicC family protein [Xaviernesmea oryzae]SEK61319.1 TIGR00255 family protein [Xaviernesmea oryzae]
MPLQSMTGFARSEGTTGRFRWAWEMRSVNGKGLDLRLRLPSGVEHLEGDIRRMAGEVLSRGNLQIGLSLSGLEQAAEPVVNRDALAAIERLRSELGDLIDPAPLRLDTILSLRGIVEFREREDSVEERAARDAAVLAGFAHALGALTAMRESEGAALHAVLDAQLGRIITLVEAIEADPSRSVAGISARLMQQLALLSEHAATLDGDRLHAEVALLAAKADIREELDRLGAHVAAARALLAAGGPVGRKLDFLCQEFNREANTICSKSSSAAVTASGVELKVVIDQFREQVQNLE